MFQHKEHVRQKLKELSEHRSQTRQERQQKAEEWEKRMTEIKGKEYVYKKFEEEYRRSQLPEIEKQNEILKSKKELCKPIRHKELVKFAKKYEKELHALESKKKKQREQWYRDLGGGLPYKSKLPYNKHCKELLDQEKFQQQEEEHKIEKLKEKVRKMNTYGKMAKDLHWPSISPQKRQEMIDIKHKLKKSKTKMPPLVTKPVVYTSFSKLKKSIPKQSQLDTIPDISPVRSRNKSKNISHIQWGKSMYTEEQEKRRRKDEEKVKYKNYMKEFKPKKPKCITTNGSDDGEGFHPYYDWKTLDEDQALDDASKVVLIKEKAHMMQERSEQKEKLIGAGLAGPEEQTEVNNYLIGAIQAKLAILNRLSDKN